jgi:hypothetical protein
MTRRHAFLAFLIASLLPLALVVLADSQSHSPWKPVVTATPDQDVIGYFYVVGR